MILRKGSEPHDQVPNPFHSMKFQLYAGLLKIEQHWTSARRMGSVQHLLRKNGSPANVARRRASSWSIRCLTSSTVTLRTMSGIAGSFFAFLAFPLDCSSGEGPAASSSPGAKPFRNSSRGSALSSPALTMTISRSCLRLPGKDHAVLRHARLMHADKTSFLGP